MIHQHVCTEASVYGIHAWNNIIQKREINTFDNSPVVQRKHSGLAWVRWLLPPLSLFIDYTRWSIYWFCREITSSLSLPHHGKKLSERALRQLLTFDVDKGLSNRGTACGRLLVNLTYYQVSRSTHEYCSNPILSKVACQEASTSRGLRPWSSNRVYKGSKGPTVLERHLGHAHFDSIPCTSVTLQFWMAPSCGVMGERPGIAPIALHCRETVGAESKVPPSTSAWDSVTCVIWGRGKASASTVRLRNPMFTNEILSFSFSFPFADAEIAGII